MKKLAIIGSFIATALAISCSSDSEEELFDSPDCSVTVSLGAQVLPVLESNCAVEFCHSAGSGLPDFSVKANVMEYAAEIKKRTREGSMPPPSSGMTLTSEEINRISCWVDQGKQDN